MRALTRALALLGLAVALMLGTGSLAGGGSVETAAAPILRPSLAPALRSVPEGAVPVHRPIPGAAPHAVRVTNQP